MISMMQSCGCEPRFKGAYRDGGLSGRYSMEWCPLHKNAAATEATCAMYRATLEGAKNSLCASSDLISAALASPAGTDYLRVVEAAKVLDRETVAKKMHESWSRTKRAQGFHYRGEPCAIANGSPHASALEVLCPYYHADLVPWGELPESQKDTNRHAFDDVLGPLWAVIAALGGNEIDLLEREEENT